jgi:predicted ATPase
MSASQRIADRFIISNPQQDLLGRGSMGEVYRATDTHTGETVAVKALDPRVVARDPGILERFAREGEALRQLDHPNIVRMVAAVEDEEATTGVVAHYLVMEYVAGGSLQDLLDTTRPDRSRRPVRSLPTPRVLEIALELADALTRAHYLGIIHRDLKPANVLLAEDGTSRLTDFGIAYMADTPRLTQTGILMGTVDYLSPEACEGEPIDERGDIWSFGVMLYEMLSGERPFGGQSLSATLTAILTQPVPDLASRCLNAPDALVDLVYRMLERDRQQRIPSVRLVGAELEAILKGWEVPTPVRLVPGESRFSTPTPPAGALRHNLPAQPTPFVGREAELTELARLLGDSDVRLLTILGAGGMGKTRLALEAAAAELNNFEDGVCFVALAPLKSPEAIVASVAEALGFRFYEGGEPRQQLLDYLRQKAKLILMDNYEHLLDGVGLVSDVLRSAAQVKILSTSRVRLKVQGENLFQLGGMDYPDWETPEDALQYSAVKLFLQSARRVRPGFELAVGDLKYVARICRLVQGMPLGILLAAGWLEMLNPGEIADEIEASLDFLETDLRDVPERQRSMRAIFEHSWNLLTEREREVFRGLSVFRGGFSRVAAQEVTGASLRELRALVDKSLLGRESGGRYGIHELLRQYAEEKLDQVPGAGQAVRDSHCTYYTAMLQGFMADLKSSRQMATLAKIDGEIDNVRASWRWAVERGRVEQLDQALEPMAFYYEQRCFWSEAEVALRHAANELACPEWETNASPDEKLRHRVRVWAKLLAWQGVCAFWLRHNESASQVLQRSLEILEGLESTSMDTRQERAFALGTLGYHVGWNLGDREEGRRLLKQSLTLYTAVGGRWEMGYVLANLGFLSENSGAYGEARRYCEESVALRKAVGDCGGTAWSLGMLSIVTLQEGQIEKAGSLIQEGLALLERQGGREQFMPALWFLGWASKWAGKFFEACSVGEETLAFNEERRFRAYSVSARALLSQARVHLGQYRQARTQAQMGLEVAREIGFGLGAGLVLLALGRVALAEESYLEAQRLLEESAAAHREHGAVHDVGISLGSLAIAARAAGQLPQARQQVCEALHMAVKIGSFVVLINALPAAALLLADEGQRERAVEMYALVSRYGYVADSQWYEDVVGRHIAALAATLPPRAAAAAQERGRARDLDATVVELLDALGD